MNKHTMLTLLMIVLGVVPSAELSVKGPARIQYAVLSIRALSDAEKARFKDVQGLEIAARLRLTNNCDYAVSYLATSGSVVPAGYHLYRLVGSLDWKSTSPARGREGPPGSELTGIAYAWLELPPHASVEFDAHDWKSIDEEHAFSTFIRDGSQVFEKISDSYSPLAK